MRRIKGLIVLAVLVIVVAFALPERTANHSNSNLAIALPGQGGDDQTVPEIRNSSTGQLPFEPLVKRSAARPADSGKKNGAAVPAEDNNWSVVTVAPGDNLSLIFSRLKLSERDLHFIARSEPDGRMLRKLKPGQTLRIKSDDGRVRALVVELDALNSLWIEGGDERYETRIESVEPEIRVSAATTEITQSLFVDGQKVGLSDAVIMRLTEIFGWDIDFALDIRKRDRFSVIYEEVFKDGTRIKQGRILAAEFVNRGKRHRAIHYTNVEGESDYYSDDGRAMRKAFLRTPVNFTRISSKFNLRRRHPVLNTIRAHRGVDYAAPMGTPVRATSNGKVHFAGKNGGYGRVVELRHGRAYGTLYAHLSRIAKGMRRGTSVRQGQIIGYVGKSGLATGPHLHYEFRVNGVHRNPLTVDLPKAEALEAKYLPDFQRHARPYLARLEALRDREADEGHTLVAQLDAETLEYTTGTFKR